jgi:hypothetical protein
MLRIQRGCEKSRRERLEPAPPVRVGARACAAAPRRHTQPALAAALSALRSAPSSQFSFSAQPVGSRASSLSAANFSRERRHAGASLTVSSWFFGAIFRRAPCQRTSHALTRGNRSDDRGHGGPGSAVLAGALLSARRRALQPLHQSAGGQEING